MLTSAAIVLASTQMPLERDFNPATAPITQATSGADDQAQAPAIGAEADLAEPVALTATDEASEPASVDEDQAIEPSANSAGESDVPVPPPFLAPDLSGPSAPDAPANPGADAPVAEGAEIVITGRKRDPGDPLARINAQSFAITQAIDEAVIEPTATAYEKAVPEPVRNGLRNFANNLHEPAVFVNFILQLKIGKAAETLGRFAINTTVGVGGLFDVAKRKPINLPRRRNGFADTLGCYGVPPGPFLFLPLIGPTTVRDLIGGSVDGFVIPLPLPGPAARQLRQPTVALARSAARELDKRVEFDEEITDIRKSEDPYVASRTYYLRKRQAEIESLCGTKGTAVSSAPADQVGDTTSGAVMQPAEPTEPSPAPPTLEVR